jgi:hypothetical protein
MLLRLVFVLGENHDEVMISQNSRPVLKTPLLATRFQIDLVQQKVARIDRIFLKSHKTIKVLVIQTDLLQAPVLRHRNSETPA